MMHIRKFVAFILTFVILFTLCAPAASSQVTGTTTDSVSNAIDTVSDSLMRLNDTASSGEARALADIFKSFMTVAQTSGQVLSLVNGSVTFLRLIGVMTDPTQAKLDGILSKLQTIDERLSSMDDKLNDLTTAMSEIKASLEFNTRAEKALLYEETWRDFSYRYMEDGMDKLITQYNSMLRAGLMSWCNGSRNVNNVDNSRIILLYKDGKLTFSDYNGIPSNITAEDSWVILPSECLPDTFYYDINSFNDDLSADIAMRISNTILHGKLDTIESQNFPLLTEEGVDNITPADIQSLATDAVNTLVYRVASAKVNENQDFSGEVKRQFSNYCNHLQASEDGLDATLKTIYLTHAFEYSAAEDIENFCDRMIILTGTYGMFACNVLGMSHLISDNEKETAVSQMTSAIEMTNQARTNGITGNGNYCYITGTNLYYTTVTFNASAKMKAHYTISNTALESFNGTQPSSVYGRTMAINPVPVGDSAIIILMNTLKSNGVTPDHSYLNKNIGDGSVTDYKKIVTSYGAPSTLSFDGKTKLHVRKAFGDYFSDNSTITSLPSKAGLDDVLFRREISGSLYDPRTGSMASNTALLAIAAYGESHFYWSTDEGAFMGGPSDNSSFKDTYTVTKTGTDTRGVIREHAYNVCNSYNIVLSSQQIKMESGKGYKPLRSFAKAVPYSKYETDSEWNNPQQDVNINIPYSDKSTTSTKKNQASSTKSNEKTDPTSRQRNYIIEYDEETDLVTNQQDSNAKLNLTTKTKSESSIRTTATNKNEIIGNNNTTDDQSNHRQKNPLLIVTLVTVSMIVLAAILFFILKKRKKN